MSNKTEQLQIRVTPRQKAALKRLAAAAGRDVSSYVLSRLAPAEQDRFAALLRALASEEDPRFVLADLHDFLEGCTPAGFGEAVATAAVERLSPYLRNYVAAMVEVAASRKGVTPPRWVQDVMPLDSPAFATTLAGLRMHLLLSAPVPFKRRNLFVDSSVGSRV
jgi:uncharacterized protein (DUF1778 family)